MGGLGMTAYRIETPDGRTLGTNAAWIADVWAARGATIATVEEGR